MAPDSEALFDFEQPITEATSIYAIWTYVYIPPTYTISISSDGGGVAYASRSSATGGTYIKLTVKPSEGYIFKEWNIIKGNVSIINESFIMPEGHVELRAVFEKIPSDDSDESDNDEGGIGEDDSDNDDGESSEDESDKDDDKPGEDESDKDEGESGKDDSDENEGSAGDNESGKDEEGSGKDDSDIEDDAGKEDDIEIGHNYGIISSVGTEYKKGNESSVRISIKASKDDFEGVIINGEVVPTMYYSIEETDSGNIMITLKDVYLDTLKEGRYHVTLKFADGYSKTDISVSAASGQEDKDDLSNSEDSGITENKDDDKHKLEDIQTGDTAKNWLFVIAFVAEVLLALGIMYGELNNKYEK
jgi:hypothetical protein